MEENNIDKRTGQGFMFEVDEHWKEHWNDMPEFVQENLEPVQQIIVSFEKDEDVQKFAELIGQKITPNTKSLWFPEVDRGKPSDFIYTNESGIPDIHNQ